MRMTDLKSLMLAGDEVALRRFYGETKPKLLAWVRQRLGNEADIEEVVQDTYLAFIDSLPLYRGKASLWTFLVSIAKHEVADYWRKRYAKKAIMTVPFMDEIYKETLWSAKETEILLEHAYAELLPEERILLVWKYEESKTIREIAALLGVGVKAAESRLFRARKRFQLVYEGVRGEV
jgi:RNA polymerase sigma-70 factor, ECF subfamily